jgi:adenylate kinase family enzyme
VRIAIIGNVASGKSTLARQISKEKSIPVTFIDSIQFLPDLSIRPYQETIEILSNIQKQSSWIIDGYGPLDILEQRFKLADQIIFCDPPVHINYFRLLKRQLINIFSPRAELPTGANELSWSHTQKLFKTINQQHQKMRPELLRILNRPENLKKLIHRKD